MDKYTKTCVAAALPGLATGDALSWTSLVQNSQALPSWLGRIRREIETDMLEYKTTSLPKPFSLNQSPEKLIPGPGDTTEWAVWTAKLLLENQGHLTQEILHEAWQKLSSSSEDIRGRISVQSTLENIKTGLTAPQTGRFNPHYFDDAALPRAMVIGVTHAGDLQAAKSMAELDASFTQFEDGIWSATAVAILFSQACSGHPVPELIQTLIDYLPEKSLTKTTVIKALDGLNPLDSDMVNTAFFLSTEICNQIYSYGNVAHEILAALLTILKATDGHPEQMLAYAALIPTAGGALMALSSALSAAISGKTPYVKQPEARHQKIRGLSIPDIEGVNLNDITEQLSHLAISLDPKG